MKEEAQTILWTDFKNCKSSSLDNLYKEYADDLYCYGLKICGDSDLVKDCIHDVFIQLIDRREKLKISPRINIFLYKSFRNKLFEILRSKNRKQDIIINLAATESNYQKPAEQTIIEEEEDVRIRNMLEKSVEKLSDHQKEIIYLKYTKGFSYEEISEVLHIDVSSARTLLYRTLKILKKTMSSGFLMLFT